MSILFGDVAVIIGDVEGGLITCWHWPFAVAFFSLNSFYPFAQTRRAWDYNILCSLTGCKADIPDACQT
jgi:hypothetical protein